MPNYILLLGGPGAGKGTQAQHLCQKFGLPQVASGDLFRDNLKRQTPLGQTAKQFMDRGELVLTSTRGDTWRFEEADAKDAKDAKTWNRVPERADGLQMVRQ